jgi:hypothetical protein
MLLKSMIIPTMQDAVSAENTAIFTQKSEK